MSQPPSLDRYACQLRVPALGGAGAQARLGAARAVVVGLGATGSALAEALVRAGVGRVRLIDRDLLELGNLHRQSLYDEDDVRQALPKAEAARRRLARVNSEVALEAEVADLDGGNARRLLGGAGVVLDGTDNFATRFVINDACAALGTPWVYAGVVGTQVHGFPVVPGRTPCFRCYLPEPPPPGAVATCETAGVLGPAVLVAAGFAALEALKLLALPDAPPLAEGLLVCDVWTRESRRVGLRPDPDCPSCRGRYPALEAPPGGSAELCGQDAVAVRPARRDQVLDVAGLAERLRPLGAVGPVNAHLLRFTPRDPAGLTLTVFRDGRAIVAGTRDPAAARSAYARYVGA